MRVDCPMFLRTTWHFPGHTVKRFFAGRDCVMGGRPPLAHLAGVSREANILKNLFFP